MNNTKMNICILGAGIGGLATAHELIKQGHQVSIYERNPLVGGLARSYKNENGQFNEYCWHAVGASYHHMLALLNEIPNTTHEGKTKVIDYLKGVDVWTYGAKGDFAHSDYINSFMSSDNVTDFLNGFKNLNVPLSWKEHLKLIGLLLFVQTSDAKDFEKYDQVSWMQLMDNLNPELKKWAIDSTSILLGMETNRLNTHTILSVLQSSTLSAVLPTYQGDEIPLFYSFDGSIYDRWFQPWINLLEQKGVKFHLNTPIERIHCENNKVKYIQLQGSNEIIQADIFINSLGPEVLPKLLHGAPQLSQQMKDLSIAGRQIQMQILYKFHEKIIYEGSTLLYFQDTPWMIMIRAEGSFWTDDMGNDIHEMLAAGIGIWYRKGIIYNKTAIECTKEELIHEVWAQTLQAKGALSALKTADGKSLLELEYASAEIWHSHFFNKETNRFDTWEPKFSNNIGTFALRPDTQDKHLTNLLHATSCVRTNANIYNMEAAIEAGVRAANFIKNGKAEANFDFSIPPTGAVKILRFLVKGLKKIGLGNPFEYLMNKF